MPTTRSKRKASEISQENVERKANTVPDEDRKCPGTAKKAKSDDTYGIHPESTVREVVMACMQILIKVCALVRLHNSVLLYTLLLAIKLLRIK